MPTDDLPAAAEAFLGHYCQEVFSEDVQAMRADLAALLETVRAEAAPRWTLVAEGLPAEGEEVLVWIVPDDDSPAYCYFGWRRDSKWTDGVGRIEDEWVSAWRPLPPGPPEEGEEP
jgi:hypothetical protein